jgi:membrane protein YqaA with SNARE-associated domain
MASFIELLVVLLSSFGFNLIPFASPSNLFIASNSALILGAEDPATLVALGFLVALGATLAKSIHYLITFFVSKHLREKQRQHLNAEALKVKRWAFLLLFVAAATPIPDEPVVIPLGLLKYSPVKFFSAFFMGKLSITVVGAFLGSWTKHIFGVAQFRSHDNPLDSSNHHHYRYSFENRHRQTGEVALKKRAVTYWSPAISLGSFF